MGNTEFILSRLGETEVTDRKNTFFDEVLERIEPDRALIAPHCEIKARELPIHGLYDGEKFHGSNDFLTELWVSERTVAMITELRNSLNYSQILFADYLNEDMIATLRRIICRPRSGHQ